MEFEAIEDEANAIHGDLWEQLNAGGQVTHQNVIFSVKLITASEKEVYFTAFQFPFKFKNQ